MQETAENNLGSSPYSSNNGCLDPLVAYGTVPLLKQMYMVKE